jgi:hypothetical protein
MGSMDARVDAAEVDALATDAMSDGGTDGGEACRAGAERSIPCGLNGRGRERQICDGQWISEGCVDSDECTDGSAETEACGRNGRGMAERMCVGGRWGALSCADPDVCTDTMSQSRICQVVFLETRDCLDGQWTMWSGCGCQDDETRDRACGLNGRGQQSQTCTNGVWSMWTACEDPDECVDGDIEDRMCVRARIERRECDSGRWSAWSDCMARPDD